MVGDKKGLSTIVITLIIILISLVAVGIVWVVVRNVIQGGTNTMETTAKCITVDVQATAATCWNYMSAGIVHCNITLSRTGTGSEVLGGVKLAFKNTTLGASSPLLSYDGNIEPLVTRTLEFDTSLTTAQGVNRVEVNAYFNDASGNDQICSQTNSFSF